MDVRIAGNPCDSGLTVLPLSFSCSSSFFFCYIFILLRKKVLSLSLGSIEPLHCLRAFNLKKPEEESRTNMFTVL